MPTTKSGVAGVLQKAGYKKAEEPSIPLWGGPEKEGITQGLLSRFYVCRERFRQFVVYGRKGISGFSVPLEYGNMWHLCEEYFAANKDYSKPLIAMCRELCKRYPTEQEKIDKYYNVCLKQFPIYMEWWKKHPDVKNRTPLVQEYVFRVPYTLPSGRVVLLLGKWDSLDLIGKLVYLQENKSKGQIMQDKMMRQLRMDLQTGLYLVSVRETIKQNLHEFVGQLPKGHKLAGVRYNVIRRPLSGGKHTISQHKATKKKPAETKEAYYDRLAGLIKGKPEHYFMRWKVDFAQGDLERFERQVLQPILEELCDWWEYMQLCEYEPWTFREGHEWITAMRRHYRHPYGVRNVLDEGGSGELDEFLATGNEVGLHRTKVLFPELVQV